MKSPGFSLEFFNFQLSSVLCSESQKLVFIQKSLKRRQFSWHQSETKAVCINKRLKESKFKSDYNAIDKTN